MLTRLQLIIKPAGKGQPTYRMPFLFSQTDEETINNYMIIGKRILNVETRNVWDYIGVPSEEGFKLTGKKEHMENNNCYYFNHTDIVQ